MIFIVDDDSSVRTSLTRLFRSADYEVQAFADADEYLDFEAGQGSGAECVILDLLGPSMSGLDLQAVINRREPPVPVIVLTGTEDSELLLKALSAGAVKVLRKPCDPDVLLRAVAAAVAPTLPAAHASTGAGDFVSRGAGLDDPDHFVLEEGRGRYRPQGTVSFDKAVALIRGAIAAALRNQVRGLLVDTTALDGFASPDTFDRFLAVVEWADEGSGGLRLAMVARAEMIHPQKFGVLVAANRRLVSNIFATEAEARAWLAAWNGH